MLLSLVVVPFLIVGAGNQTKAKQKPKPPAKKQTTAPIKGTVQLAGDKGKLGITYQIGNVGDELHFTLDSAEVALRCKTVEDNILASHPDKLLILNYTVQNPNKREVSFDYGSFKFTCVSPDDENRESDSYTYHAERRTHFNVSLKPAQKVKAFVAFKVHGTGPITKLMVERGSNRPILRFDLKDKVKAMTSVFAPDGMNVLQTVPAPFAKPFDFGAFDINVEKVEAAPGAVGQYEPAEGQTIFVVNVSFTNMLNRPHRLAWGTFEPKLTDENGDTIEWCSDMLTLTGNQTIDEELEGGQIKKAMMVFRGVKGQKPKKLKLFCNDLQRTVNIDLP